MIQEGSVIPKFKVQDESGNTVTDMDLANRRCVVYFYPKDFTPGCTTEADEFTNMYQKFADRNITIYGVSPDDTNSHKKFCGKMNIPYTLLADTEKIMANAFGVWSLKKFMGREYMGVNRTTFLVGEDGCIFRIFTKVRPKGHAQQVLESFAK